MKLTWKTGITVVVLFIVLTACSTDLGTWKFWGKEETTIEPALPTFTMLPTVTPNQSDSITSTETAIIAVPTVTQAPPSGPSTNATGASCLPGGWQIDHQSVINYINMTMMGVREFGFSPHSSQGKLELQIRPGYIDLLAEDFSVAVNVNVGDMADISAFDAMIVSDASAKYLASDTQIALTDILYDANGTVTSLSASFSVNFDDLLTLAQTLGFARGLPNPITSRSMNYTCAGDVLTIAVNSYASVSFDRIVD